MYLLPEWKIGQKHQTNIKEMEEEVLAARKRQDGLEKKLIESGNKGLFASLGGAVDGVLATPGRLVYHLVSGMS